MVFLTVSYDWLEETEPDICLRLRVALQKVRLRGVKLLVRHYQRDSWNTAYNLLN